MTQKTAKLAVYAGTFDPITLGHLDIIERAHSLFDSVVIAVHEEDTHNKTLFNLPQRLEAVQTATAHLKGVEVHTFSGLLGAYAKSIGASVLVRGIRSAIDFNYEHQMAEVNKASSGFETILFAARPTLSIVSSTMVRQAAHVGVDISPFVPPCVLKMFK